MSSDINYVVYDLETNGVDTLTTAIMQMSLLTGDTGAILGNWYVWPHDGLIDATHIHGIDHARLTDHNAISIQQLCQELVYVMRKQYGRKPVVWVAYNNFGFDQVVLEANFKVANIRMPDNWHFMDLFPLVRTHMDVTPNYKLSSVYYTLVNATSETIAFHDALADTQCLWVVFQHCLRHFSSAFPQFTRPKLGSGDALQLSLQSFPLAYYPVVSPTSWNYALSTYHTPVTIGDVFTQFTQYVSNYTHDRDITYDQAYNAFVKMLVRTSGMSFPCAAKITSIAHTMSALLET